MIIPEGEGFLGKAVNEAERLIITDPSRDPSYLIEYDSPILSNARVTLFQLVVNSKKEVFWIIQLVDRLNSKGTIVTPNADDFLILDFLTTSLIKIYTDQSINNELITRNLTESTRSLRTERQVLPLLATVQYTVSHLIGCESHKIFLLIKHQIPFFYLKKQL
jgi:hypothetical protein